MRPLLIVIAWGGLMSGGAACASTASAPATSASPTVGLADPGTLAALAAERRNIFSDTLRQTPAVAWRGVQSAFARAGLVVERADSTTGWVISGFTQLRGRLAGVPLSRFLDCGRTAYGDNTDSYVIEMRLSSRVATGPVTGTAIVESAISATGSAPGNHERSSRCASTGRLEKQIAGLAAQAAP